jgi:hypothetical protein
MTNRIRVQESDESSTFWRQTLLAIADHEWPRLASKAESERVGQQASNKNKPLKHNGPSPPR